MPIRNLGDPVDLYASVPKTGVIQPGRYMDTLRQRFQPIAERGDVANQLSQYQTMKRDAERQQAEYAAAQRARDSAANSVNGYRPGVSSLGSGGVNGNAGGGRAGAYVNPVPGYSPTERYGSYSVSGKPHWGYDLAVPKNTRVGAPASGTVVVSGWDSGGFGNRVDIRDANGYLWILGHLNSTGVKVGQQISAGQYIGASGSSGNSTGNHLHVESRYGGGPGNYGAWDFGNLMGW